jgi:hypothetical protein
MRREILTLVSREKPQTRSARTSITKTSTQETPYSSSVHKNNNTYWKNATRTKPKSNENQTFNTGIKRRASTVSLKIVK